MNTMIVKKDDMHKLAETVKNMADGANTLMAQAGQMVDIITDHRKKLDDLRQRNGSAITKLEMMLAVNSLAQKDAVRSPDVSVLAFLTAQHQRISDIIHTLKADEAAK